MQVHELRTIYGEYRKFFVDCELHICLPESEDETTPTPTATDESLSNHIRLVTHEGLDTRISVDKGGWYHRENPETTYETFEALMQATSPNFRTEFGNELSNRLDELLHR